MKVGSLFAGIGGFDLGLERAGFKIAWQVEIDPFCQKVLQKHWPNVPRYGDIRELRGDELGAVDLICGGFPCQPFSIAGERKGNGDDRDLWPEMFRIIQEIRPRWMLGENVANFVNMELERTILNLESEGYETQAFIIPACAIGAPHRRDRVFILACTDSGRYIHRQVEKLSAETWEQTQCKPCICGKNVDDTKGQRLQRMWANREQELQTHEKPRLFSCGSEIGENWSVEPDVGRVAHGIPNRVDRLRSLGNAVVPQLVEIIGRAILRAEAAQ